MMATYKYVAIINFMTFMAFITFMTHGNVIFDILEPAALSQSSTHWVIWFDMRATNL